MSSIHYISNDILDFQTVSEIIFEHKKLALSEESHHNISACRSYLDKKDISSKTTAHTRTTGFEKLSIKAAHDHDIKEQQENVLLVHASGSGDCVPKEIVKMMLLLKVQSLSYGHSGVHISTVQRLIDFFNDDILPVVYEQDVKDERGDIVPLAHLALPLIGEGLVWDGNNIFSSETTLKAHGYKKITLHSREEEALIQGTQYTSAYGMYAIIKSHKISYMADLVGTISIVAYECDLSYFDPLLHFVRPHRGQIKTAERILEFLDGSDSAITEKDSVLDVFYFRCIPQIHGATKDAIHYATRIFKTEINSVTDYTTIFSHEDKIIKGGNSHGQPLKLALDFLGIAMAELGIISEQRVSSLVKGLRNLPQFTRAHSEHSNGMGIPKNIVNDNLQLFTPTTVDSIVSSNESEIHVNMRPNAVIKLLGVIDHVETLLSIELITSASALHYKKFPTTSAFIESFLNSYREVVPFTGNESILLEEIRKSKGFLGSFNIDPDGLY